MTTLLFLFLLAFLAGVSVQESRHRPSPRPKYALLAAAIVFAMLFFGYAVGKDLARRDAGRDAAAHASPDK